MPTHSLTEEEETELVLFLVELADIGYLELRVDVITMAQHIIVKKGIEQQITNRWCRLSTDATTVYSI